MKLKTVAGKFDNVLAEDAYAPSTTFKCQLTPLSMYRIEGAAVRRREMSTVPGVTLPTRQVLRIDGDLYLVGDNSPDFWMGERIRNNYILQGADFLAEMNSIEGELAGTARTTAYVSLDYSKAMTDERDSSDYHEQYNIFFGKDEAVDEGSLAFVDGRWFLIRVAYKAVSGLRNTLTAELATPVFETIQYGARVYNPVTDAYTDTPKSVKVFRVRWQDNFKRLSRGTSKREAGDMQVCILKADAATLKASDVLTMSDGNWKVIGVIGDGAMWNAHVRRA